jgi:cell division protein ZapA
MALVTVNINGFTHTVGCEDGQEAHLLAMAEAVDKRVGGLKELAGQGGESRLLTLAALMMEDEIHDLREALDAARAQSAPTAAPAAPQAPAADPELPRRLLSLARRAEEIAAGLERA